MRGTVWNDIRAEVHDADNKALLKAKKQECEKARQGWRYIKLTDKVMVLVPCDEQGNPTKEGLDKIERMKKLYGINF